MARPSVPAISSSGLSPSPLPLSALLSSAQCHPQQAPALDGKGTHGKFQAFITFGDSNRKRPLSPLVPISITANELWFILPGSSANLCTHCWTYENKYSDWPAWVTDCPLSPGKYGLTVDSLLPIRGVGSMEGVLQKKAWRQVLIPMTPHSTLRWWQRWSCPAFKPEPELSLWESSCLWDNPAFLQFLELAFPSEVVFPIQTCCMESGFSPSFYSHRTP